MCVCVCVHAAPKVNATDSFSVSPPPFAPSLYLFVCSFYCSEFFLLIDACPCNWAFQNDFFLRLLAYAVWGLHFLHLPMVRSMRRFFPPICIFSVQHIASALTPSNRILFNDDTYWSLCTVWYQFDLKACDDGQLFNALKHWAIALIQWCRPIDAFRNRTLAVPAWRCVTGSLLTSFLSQQLHHRAPASCKHRLFFRHSHSHDTCPACRNGMRHFELYGPGHLAWPKRGCHIILHAAQCALYSFYYRFGREEMDGLYWHIAVRSGAMRAWDETQQSKWTGSAANIVKQINRRQNIAAGQWLCWAVFSRSFTVSFMCVCW